MHFNRFYGIFFSLVENESSFQRKPRLLGKNRKAANHMLQWFSMPEEITLVYAIETGLNLRSKYCPGTTITKDLDR